MESQTEETNKILLMRLKTEQTADLPYPVECENACSFLLLIHNRVTPLTTSPRHASSTHGTRKATSGSLSRTARCSREDL